MEDLKDKEEEELKRTFTEGGAIAATHFVVEIIGTKPLI